MTTGVNLWSTYELKGWFKGLVLRYPLSNAELEMLSAITKELETRGAI